MKLKFSTILGFSALLVALCAAFFSVYGIATLFAGASISAMIMASSLEIGKLVGTTFLYRYWDKCKGFLRGYLISAILTLMIITSLGIFGYLSSAYQKSATEYGVIQEKITAMEEQKTYSKQKIDSSKKRIDDLMKLRESQEVRMNSTLTNEYVARNPLQLKQLQQQTSDLITDTDKTIKEENKKIQDSIDEIRNTDSQINDIKLGSSSKKDIQTFKFVADALNLSLDQVVRWFIIFIIFVFDPLAVCLTLAYNVAVYKKEDERLHDRPDDIDSIPSKSEVSTVKREETPTITEIKEEIKHNHHSHVPTSESPKQQNQMDSWYKSMFKLTDNK